MSLLGRPFIWKCDICGKTVYKEGYGLPRGWKWYSVRGRKGVLHRCEDHDEYPPNTTTNQDKRN